MFSFCTASHASGVAGIGYQTDSEGRKKGYEGEGIQRTGLACALSYRDRVTLPQLWEQGL